MFEFLRPNLNQSAETAAQKAKGLFNKFRSSKGVRKLNSDIYNVIEGTQKVVDYATKEFEIPEFELPTPTATETHEQFLERTTAIPAGKVKYIMSAASLFEIKGLNRSVEPRRELVTHILSICHPRRDIRPGFQDFLPVAQRFYRFYQQTREDWR